MRHSTIFKSRWMALLWAAGILWFAYDVAGGSDAGASGNQTQANDATDVTGAPVTDADTKRLEEVINGL